MSLYGVGAVGSRWIERWSLYREVGIGAIGTWWSDLDREVVSLLLGHGGVHDHDRCMIWVQWSGLTKGACSLACK